MRKRRVYKKGYIFRKDYKDGTYAIGEVVEDGNTSPSWLPGYARRIKIYYCNNGKSFTKEIKNSNYGQYVTYSYLKGTKPISSEEAFLYKL